MLFNFIFLAMRAFETSKLASGPPPPRPTAAKVLQATEKEGFVWKLSDMDSRPKPCDCLSMPPLPSYVVISFVRTFYFIRIRDIVKMREDGKLSITLEEAKIMAEKIVDY